MLGSGVQKWHIHFWFSLKGQTPIWARKSQNKTHPASENTFHYIKRCLMWPCCVTLKKIYGHFTPQLTDLNKANKAEISIDIMYTWTYFLLSTTIKVKNILAFRFSGPAIRDFTMFHESLILDWQKCGSAMDPWVNDVQMMNLRQVTWSRTDILP